MSETAVLVGQTVQSYVKDFNWDGITLTVDPRSIYLDDRWWHVSVRPTRWPDRMFRLIEELAITEERLEEEQHLKVALSLGNPENEDTESTTAVA